MSNDDQQVILPDYVIAAVGQAIADYCRKYERDNYGPCVQRMTEMAWRAAQATYAAIQKRNWLMDRPKEDS